jgi:broad specificity phosphatase PhoE
MTRLILIRHGQSEANLTRRFAGHFNAPLTELGRSQAEKSAEYVAENYKVSKVYASDLARAFATGQAVADRLGLEIIPDVRLREIRAGKWEGMEIARIAEEYAEDYKVWMSDIGHSKPTDGEKVSELAVRVLDVIKEIAEQNEGLTVVLATHATPIRVTECMVKHGNLDPMKDIPWVTNASISELIYENGKFEFKTVSYDEHLKGLQTKMPANV